MSHRIRSIAASLVVVLGAGVLVATVPVATAAPDDRTFAPLRGFDLSGSKIRVEPKAYAATRVDLAGLRDELPAGEGSAVVRIPAPDGSLQAFRVEQTQRMESGLAGAHPEIRTWSGRGVDDPRATVALDITPMGFHAFVRTPGGRSDWYVDPAYNRRGSTAHLSYFSADLPAPQRERTEGEITALRDTVRAAQAKDADAGRRVDRHFYRLALTSDPSYAAYFGTDNVLAEKVTLINRVNQIYNDDLATELRLVNETDKLNFDTEAEATGPDGPCGSAPCFDVADPGDPTTEDDDLPGDLDGCTILTLGQNRTVLGQLIGASSYDVGHIALGKDGGGVAYLGVVGGDYKGGGCTGLAEPKGDFFAIDYVAHEIGHQFGGNHTFNGAAGNCADNISEASVEPGSGSSVMAYAGICGRDDLQPHTDPYFSFLTVDEVEAVQSTPYNVIEVQTVSLRGFDADGESITLDFPGATGPITLTRGTDYTNAGVEAAVETLTGQDVSIAQWGYDEVFNSDEDGNPLVEPIDDRGFQVIFNEEPRMFFEGGPSDLDQPPLTVASGSAGVSGFVGETEKGGPADNNGIDLPQTDELADNTAPVVTAPAARTIPIRTPFALTGSGTDADGDPLVYLWEQADFGSGTSLPDNRKVYGPLFRVFGDDAVVSDEDSLKSPSPGINLADGSPTRVFPDMAQILAGNTNAATGSCPPATGLPNRQLPDTLLDCYSEFLPGAEYLGSLGNTTPAIRFRLTARDLFPNGGGLAHDDVTLGIDPGAGPFLVTSQAGAGTTVPGGATVPVTWAVNNTQRLAASVKVSLSTDGGATFGTVLAASTPNDGSERLTMPNVTSGDVRIKIEAVDNYFFDVNDASFKLAAVPSPETTVERGPKDGAIVLERKQRFRFGSSTAPATFECTLDGKEVDCADGSLTVKAKPGTHELVVAAVNAAGVADATPERRTFTRPHDDGAFRQSGRWTRVKDRNAYGNDYVASQDRGAELSKKVRRATRVVLVVTTTKQPALLNVYVGQKRIKTVNLRGKNRSQALRKVDLRKTRTGELRLVVVRGPVRVEGVAVVTD
ncbi:hypothetical protein HN031_04255 [Nocardioides sp. zg-1308]|uniref:reprolysin-like metallopeptidase n=1 Tax=Nocardioides sp. zg-1308 TaxID=2736253 RepID=UPI0015541F0C|nr:M12 family metallo-peptidase [Nocardioides sp. zg-1308]NPD03896.1 hypothetical protein [Nocardioides sp. zg-1308]